MTPQPPNPRSVFGRAVELDSATERKAYLDEACAGSPDVRERVEVLLRAHEAAGGFLRPAAGGSADTASYTPSPEPPNTVGPYKLLEKIGEGGMGEVWVADQTEPIKRRVALKLIKPGMDSRGVLARFEAERQALAVMDHPNIAKVLDAGTTPDGRPYFVMELVKGTPITEFCDVRKLTPKERLELFVPVCQAIQHAHMKGIIHRDIKPSNVLVALHDEKPVPKVIDFGVAKAVGQQLTEKTIYTGFGALVGTPAYMAPEQATFNQLDVDTRADVYALGVLLYELLAGSPPIEKERLNKAALDEVLRIVRDEEPVRPSQRLSTSQTKATIAATRQSEPGALSQMMKGELDWIVMKALEKDRTRRYDTATALAKDVQRYLTGDAVEACPPTLGYRLKKAYRRNRAAVLVGGAFATLLTVGVVAALVLAIRATTAERMAAADRDAALESGKEAADQRDAARAARDELRHALYASDFQRALSARQSMDRVRVLELLDRHIPKPGESDIRGFEWYYLNRQCRESSRSHQLVPGPKWVSPDGSRVYVMVGYDPMVAENQHVYFRVWDLGTGHELPTFDPFPGDTSGFLSIESFSRNGERAVVQYTPLSGQYQPTGKARIAVFDLVQRKQLFTLPPYTALQERVNVVLSARGDRLVERRLTSAKPQDASGPPRRKSVAIWSVDEGKVVRALSLDENKTERFDAEGLAFHPTENQFAAVVHTNTPDKQMLSDIRTWDLGSGEVIWRCPVERTNGTTRLAYSPNGKYLAEAPIAKPVIHLRNPATGVSVHMLAVQSTGTPFEPKTLTFNATDSQLAVTMNNMRPGVQVWDVPPASSTTEVLPTRTIPTDTEGISIGFVADGRSLIMASFHHIVETKDVIDLKVTLPGPEGGKVFVVSAPSSTSDRSWAIWEFPKAERPHFEVRIWDLSGHVVLSKKVDSLGNSPNNWFSCSLTADGKKFVLAQSFTHPTDATQDRGVLCLWDVETKDELSRMELPGGRIHLGAVRPDGRQLALARTNQSRPISPTSTTKTRLSLWDLWENKEAHGEESEKTVRPWPATYSPDGSRVVWSLGANASTYLGSELRVWETAQGKTAWTRDAWPSRYPMTCERLVFSPDGRSVVVSMGGTAPGGTLFVVDAETGRDLRPPLDTPGGVLQSARFSPDGRRLFALAGSGPLGWITNDTPVVWDLPNGRELLRLPTAKTRAWSLDREGRRMRLIKDLPNSPDLVLETLDGSPLPEPVK